MHQQKQTILNPNIIATVRRNNDDTQVKVYSRRQVRINCRGICIFFCDLLMRIHTHRNSGKSNICSSLCAIEIFLASRSWRRARNLTISSAAVSSLSLWKTWLLQWLSPLSKALRTARECLSVPIMYNNGLKTAKVAQRLCADTYRNLGGSLPVDPGDLSWWGLCENRSPYTCSAQLDWQRCSQV